LVVAQYVWKEVTAVQVIYERCCGLDVHKRTIMACMLKWSGGEWQKEIRQFGTMTKDLLALLDWLLGEGCTHVAMESTGVYWKPVYNILEGQLQLLVVNAQHLKAVPGRKTDVRDAEWIAELLAHGLLRGSFVPPASVRELRELTRYRTSLVRDRARTVNRLQKVLESANIKLASVVSDIEGVSARLMLEALVAGQRDTEQLASLAKGRLKDKHAQLVEALSCRLQPHQSFLIAEHLAQVDYLDGAIERLSREIEERLRPFEQELSWLDTIPGVNRRTAEVLWAETGGDMSRFASARHLASWAGMCPGNNESAGKRRTGRTRKGSPWLRHCLVEAAHGAGHTKNKYLSSQYHRLGARRGKKKALVAVGHSILVIAYHLLTRKQPYSDLGANYFDERDRQAVTKRCLNRLQKLGYQVTLDKVQMAA
jgi:transposase